MDCYRIVGEDQRPALYGHEVIRSSLDPGSGCERKPMQIAEARVTLGVAAARAGDVGRAMDEGRLALAGERLSLPSLLMCSNELATHLRSHFGLQRFAPVSN